MKYTMYTMHSLLEFSSLTATLLTSETGEPLKILLRVYCSSECCMFRTNLWISCFME